MKQRISGFFVDTKLVSLMLLKLITDWIFVNPDDFGKESKER